MRNKFDGRVRKLVEIIKHNDYQNVVQLEGHIHRHEKEFGALNMHDWYNLMSKDSNVNLIKMYLDAMK